jgi:excisionase family DNA binding protein
MALEKETLEPAAEEEKERLFTVDEMCKLLQVDKRTMCDWIQYRKIPYVRLDKKFIRFRMSDIVKWVQRKQHKRGAGRIG